MIRLSSISRLSLLLIGGLVCAAQASPTEMGLEDLISSALQKNGEIKEVEQDVAIAVAQKDRASAAAWPMGSATVIGAPLPEIQGDHTVSNTDTGKWGPFVTGSIQFALPLYTFGQIGGYKNAADNQITANQELAKMKRSEVILRTKELYYQYLMAVGLEKLVDSVLEILEEAEKDSDKKMNKKGSKVSLNDVYQLKTEVDNIRQLRLQAIAGRKTAEKAIAWISGANFTELPQKKLKAESFEKKSMEEYLDAARRQRPEFKALEAGQAARASLRDAKRAQSYPSFFFGGQLGFAWTDMANKQPSIFLNDPFNRILGGAGVGFKLDLEFARHAAEAAEEEAQRMKLKAKEMYAVPGIDLQVKKAYWEVEKTIEGLEIAKRRQKTAHKWFMSNASGWTLGIAKARDLMDSLEGDSLAKKNYIETVFAHNMALANLSHAIGGEVTDLRYGAVSQSAEAQPAVTGRVNNNTDEEPDAKPTPNAK